MAKRAGSESLVLNVYAQLRSDIFDRRLQPGERLRPVDLGRQFDVSVGVMREALGLLSAQNLVRIERNRGFHVVELSVEALGDLTEARKINEGSALRLSIERGDIGWESDVLAAHHRMASEPMYPPEDSGTRSVAWAAYHIAFHQTLIAACGNSVLLDICTRLSDAAELYRAWSGDGGKAVRDIPGEHKRLMEAAVAHDADLAVKLFEQHVDKTKEIVLELDQESSSTTTTADGRSRVGRIER